MTRRHTAGQCREQQLMERIQAQGEHTWGLPVLCDCFHTTSPFGSHLCLVMHILGGSISDLRKAAPGKALPVHLVKTIITQLVKAVAQLHELGIIHTGAPRFPSGSLCKDLVRCSLIICGLYRYKTCQYPRKLRAIRPRFRKIS